MQGRRAHLVQRRAWTDAQGGHEASSKVLTSRHVSFGELKQYQSNSGDFVPSPLKMFERLPFASKPRAVVSPRRAIAGHAEPRMAVAPPQWEDGDDNFEVVLSRLAPSDELQEVRRRIREVESKLQDAIDEEDYAAAARLRDEGRELSLKDPEALISSLSTQLEAAVKAERYEQAAKYTAQLRELKLRFLPEYKLAGRWLTRELFNINIGANSLGGWSPKGSLVRMSYNGDTLTAAKADGEAIFSADVSQALPKPDGPELEFHALGFSGSNDPTRFFPGEGMVPGEDSVRGQMYLINDNFLGFWWPLRAAGGGSKVLVAAGGGGGGDRGRGDGGEEGGAFVLFQKIGGPNEDDAQYFPDIGKTLKQDSPTNIDSLELGDMPKSPKREDNYLDRDEPTAFRRVPRSRSQRAALPTMGFFDALSSAFENDDTLGKREEAGLKKKAKAITITFKGPKPEGVEALFGEQPITETQAIPGQKLRDVARRADIPIKYSCNEGSCRVCRVSVDGQEVLACTAKVPKNDVTVAYPGLKGSAKPKSRGQPDTATPPPSKITTRDLQERLRKEAEAKKNQGGGWPFR